MDSEDQFGDDYPCFEICGLPFSMKAARDSGQKKELTSLIWNIYRNPVNQFTVYPLFFHSGNGNIQEPSRHFHCFHRYDYDNDGDYIQYNRSSFSG